MKFFIFLFYLALLSMLGFIATDMYLPAFKAIESSFNSSPSQVAMSLTCFLAGLALGQLIYGPLVSKLGKRYALILGLGIFAASSVAIANSDSILMLNIARFFQAIGACSAGVIWQAIVVEQYDAEKAQHPPVSLVKMMMNRIFHLHRERKNSGELKIFLEKQ